jgi:hypothetical protein
MGSSRRLSFMFRLRIALLFGPLLAAALALQGQTAEWSFAGPPSTRAATHRCDSAAAYFCAAGRPRIDDSLR